MKRLLVCWFVLPAALGLATDRYVAPGGAHTPPFTNWAMAATNLQSAVNWANTNNAGDTVWVSNGLYLLPATVIVSNAVVRGPGADPGAAVISGGGARRCFLLAHPNARLDTLTLSNGIGGGGGGVKIGTGTVHQTVVVGCAGGSYGGGGINIQGSGLVSHCTLLNNHSRHGGGVFVQVDSSSAVIEDCLVVSNWTSDALGGGGGISLQTGTVARCLVAHNLSSNFGGGVMVYSGSGMYRDCTIRHNRANSGGGASSGGTFIRFGIEDCLIANNTATNSYGGGLYFSSTTATGSVWDCTIASNTTPQYGGGGYLVGPIEVRDSIFLANGPASHGAAAWMQAGAILRSCLVTAHTGAQATIYVQNTGTLENCTIVGNTADKLAALRLVVANDMRIVNSLIYGNWLTNGTPYDISLGVASATNAFFYSGAGVSSQTLPPAQGNISDTPVWVNAGAGDYRLQRGSRGIDEGTNLPWMDGALDLDGRARLDWAARRVDMGAYERMPAGALLLLR